MAVSDIVRQLGISEQIFYRGKKHYGGMQSECVRELKIRQDENSQLKKLVAELSLDNAILQDAASKSGAARARVARRFRARGEPAD
jgi:putative transposase